MCAADVVGCDGDGCVDVVVHAVTVGVTAYANGAADVVGRRKKSTLRDHNGAS